MHAVDLHCDNIFVRHVPAMLFQKGCLQIPRQFSGRISQIFVRIQIHVDQFVRLSLLLA